MFYVWSKECDNSTKNESFKLNYIYILLRVIKVEDSCIDVHKRIT